MSEPASDKLAGDDQAPDTPRFFSLTQRIGRLRYFAYTLIAMLACSAALLLIYLVATTLLPPALGRLVSTASFILIKNVAVPLIVFVMTIRRLHDFNASGWWSLSVIMPFVTLIFLCVPGSRSSNRYGAPLVPNSTGLRFAAIALPIALLGVYVSLYGGRQEGAAGTGSAAPTAPGAPGLRSYGN